MTEDEAKAKWCPHARVFLANMYEEARNMTDPVCNRTDMDCPSVIDHYANCIGSNCMSWRWVAFKCDDAWVAAVQKAADDIGDKSSNRAKAAAHVNKNRALYGLPVSPTEGFCGLAGAP